MNKLLRLVKNSNLLKNASFASVSLPIFGSFYRKIYKKQIDKKLAGFKLSDMLVSIEPTNVCNSKCVMCPYQKMTRPKEVMPMYLFKKIVDDCRDGGIRKFNLNFYNEPFLDPLIFERIKYLKSKGVHVKLFSNGSVLKEEMFDKIFESGIDEIDFSVDGSRKETYEKIRYGLNFENTVNNILGLISAKKERGFGAPKINVAFVKQKENKGEVEEFKKFWSGKADKIITAFDDNRNETSEFFDKKSKSAVSYPCRKLWTEIVVMSNGKVALCCVDYDGSVVMGDFNKQTLKEIWNGEKFKKARRLHLDFKSKEIPVCKNCVHSYRMNARSWW